MTTPHASACLALCLHASEDPNGNSFVSSSSSSSSSLPGETSPDLLSSPSGEGWADHHHMLEDMVRGKADALTDDTSTSLYLDARSGRTWSDHNDNVLIAISAATPTTDRSFGWHSDDMDDELSEGRGCSSPGSDATEVPADDDGDDDDVEADEEESLFLSLCSELSLRTSSGPQQSLPSEGPPTLEDSHCSLTPRTLTPTSSSSSSSTFTNQLSDSRESDVEVCEVCLKTNPLPKAPDRPGLAEAPVSTETKPANQEARRVRRPDLKNIKAKVVSRTTPSAAKLANRRQSVPAYQRRDVPRKEEVQVNREKGPSWASVGVKARPVPCFSIQSKERRRSSLAYGTLSVSSRSDLGSEVVVNNVTKTTPDTSLRQKVSSKLGPGAKQQTSGRAPGASSTTGPGVVLGSSAPGQGGSGSRLVHAESSSLGKEAASGGGGSQARARLSHNQSKSIPKPRLTTERRSSLATQCSVTSNTKAVSANQAVSLLPWGRSAAATSPSSGSKLPVKGLHRSLSSSSLEISPAENNREAEEKPSRGAPSVGNQSLDKPPGPSTAAASSTIANTRAPGTRSRALSLQSRPTTIGLKPPTITGPSPSRPTNYALNHKTPASANQAPATKPSQNPLQRSGSARINRPTATVSSVDKNKPRGAVARPTHPGSTTTTTTTTTTPGSTSPGPNYNLNHNLNLQPPAEIQAPGLLNGNGPSPHIPPQTSEVGPGTTGPISTTQGFGVRTGSRTSGRPPPRVASGPGSGPRPGAGGGCAKVEEKRSYSKEQVEEKRLRRLLVQGNRRVEALATVIQHILSEREVGLNQKKDLSHQLTNLKDELTSSTLACERLQKEKNDVLSSHQEALRSMEEQHKEELAQLEDRLRSFYQAEWDKVHQRYQEEADRYRTIMEQQVEELRSRQEAELRKHEVAYSQEAESLKQCFKSSLQDLQNSHQESKDQLDRRLQETEASLSERVSVLLHEKEELQQKRSAEEEATRRSLTEPRSLYLQQELDSLKVVLEMKTSQLHLKDKKLMEMEKLVDANVKLEECMNRVQQENEDYRARMDKHAARSKQLTSEQALLQQTLQKESKVNKRLSMENEELLWKLHHGDPLGSPRRLSPTSPCHSPQNSTPFPTAPPLSPR